MLGKKVCTRCSEGVENVGGATDPFLKDSTIILLKKCALHVKENIETIKKEKMP